MSHARILKQLTMNLNSAFIYFFSVHYANMPLQYTANLMVVKMTGSILFSIDMVDRTGRDFWYCPRVYRWSIFAADNQFHCHTNVDMSYRQLYRILNSLNYLSGAFCESTWQVLNLFLLQRLCMTTLYDDYSGRFYNSILIFRMYVYVTNSQASRK